MITIHADETGTLILGRVGENGCTQVVWDRIIAAWRAEYPNAAIGLINRPSRQDQGYPVGNTQTSGGVLTWTVLSSDLSEDGWGQCQLVAIEDEVIKKSAFWDTRVLPSLTGSATPPDPIEEWWNAFVALKGEAEAAAESASGSATSASTSATKARTSEQAAAVSETQARIYAGTASDAATSAQQSAYSANSAKNTATQKASEAAASAQAAAAAASHYPKIENGYWYVWSVQTGAYVSTGVEAGATGPQGPQGPQGEPGQDGVNAYVWIRYAFAQPTQDSDMSTTPGPWQGVYSGSSAAAPAHYTDYTWNKVEGPQGPQGLAFTFEDGGMGLILKPIEQEV